MICDKCGFPKDMHREDMPGSCPSITSGEKQLVMVDKEMFDAMRAAIISGASWVDYCAGQDVDQSISSSMRRDFFLKLDKARTKLG